MLLQVVATDVNMNMNSKRYGFQEYGASKTLNMKNMCN